MTLPNVVVINIILISPKSFYDRSHLQEVNIYSSFINKVMLNTSPTCPYPWHVMSEFLVDTLIDMLLRWQVVVLKMTRVGDIGGLVAGSTYFMLCCVEFLVFIHMGVSYNSWFGTVVVVLGVIGWVDFIAEMIWPFSIKKSLYTLRYHLIETSIPWKCAFYGYPNNNDSQEYNTAQVDPRIVRRKIFDLSFK